MRSPLQRRRLHRTWTEPAGTVQAFPVIEPDENDGQTWEEMQQAADAWVDARTSAQIDRAIADTEDKPA